MTNQNYKVIKVHPNDNVIVALEDIPAGAIIIYENETYQIVDDIAAKHKFYQSDMQPGDAVTMYGVLVGKVQIPVTAGMRMTTTNLHHAAEPYSFRPYNYTWTPPNVDAYKNKTFLGYHRSDGTVGTANYWLFIPTVFCENRNLDVIREALHNELGYAVTHKYKSFTKQLLAAYEAGEPVQNFNASELIATQKESRVFKNIDGVKFLNHQGGCGGTRGDAAILSKLLAAYADHPNVAGITVLSLGCQNLQLQDLENDIKLRNPNFDKPLYIFEQQNAGTEEDLIYGAIKKLLKG